MMDRLTKRNEIGIAELKEPYECEDCGHLVWHLDDHGNGEPVSRLAAYEETGFAPEQVKNLYKALAKAAYRCNGKFKDYTDRYAVKHKITPAEALRHELVKQACLMYMYTD